jgi:tetratricopeptide (TPR) repeat protein
MKNKIYIRSVRIDLILVVAFLISSCGANKNRYGIKSEEAENSMPDTSSVAYYFDLAENLSNKGNYEAAIKTFNKAIDINPNIAALYFNRGLAKSELKLFSDAVSDMEIASKLSPSDLSIINTKGIVESEGGFYKKALSDFNYVIKTDPTLGNCYIDRGLLKIKMGLKNEACEDFYSAKRLNEKEADYCIRKNCLKI